MGVQEEKRAYKCLGRSRITPFYRKMRFGYVFFLCTTVTKISDLTENDMQNRLKHSRLLFTFLRQHFRHTPKAARKIPTIRIVEQIAE